MCRVCSECGVSVSVCARSYVIVTITVNIIVRVLGLVFVISDVVGV